MLGAGLIVLSTMGLYLGLKYTSSREYKIAKLFNKTLLAYPHQTTIRNSKGYTFSLYEIHDNDEGFGARLNIPRGLSEEEFKKVVPSLKNSFKGEVEYDNYYIIVKTKVV